MRHLFTASRRAAFCALLFSLCAVPGCKFFNDLTGQRHDGPLIVAPSSPIADVPVPAGFTMTDDSTSKVVPGNSIRFVDHHYKGNDDVLPVVKFFRDHMPEKGWTWIDQSQTRGSEITLHYTKNNEDCIVIVTPGSFRTAIHVKIDPIGRDAQK